MAKDKSPELTGHLGPIEPAGLLQSVSLSRLTGVLKVDDGPNSILVLFDFGKPTHARMGKLKGQRAIRSFVMEWDSGLFQFFKGSNIEKLDEDCAVRKPLDRLLIDCFKDSADGSKKAAQNKGTHIRVVDNDLPANHLKCSFCGKSKDQVKKFIAGSNVNICGDCVKHCNDMMDES